MKLSALRMTAKVSYVHVTRATDSTGKLLAGQQQSALLGKVEVEIWNGDYAIVRSQLPIFKGRTEVSVGNPDAMLGDQIAEEAKNLAREAWKRHQARNPSVVEVTL